MQTLPADDLSPFLSLLADRSDPQLHAQLVDHLQKLDNASLHALRDRARHEADDYVLMELDRHLHARIWEELVDEVPAILKQDQRRLLDLWLLLNRFGRLELDVADLERQLDELTEACAKAGDDVAALSRVLGQERGFLGNQRDYYSPDNSYLDQVLETQLGIPISLSALYLVIAERLSVPLRGVGLPGHFIIGHFPEEGTVSFYDPFRGGAKLSRSDCRGLVASRGVPFGDHLLQPVSDAAIFKRMCLNLLQIYRQRGQLAQSKILQRLILACES